MACPAVPLPKALTTQWEGVWEVWKVWKVCGLWGGVRVACDRRPGSQGIDNPVTGRVGGEEVWGSVGPVG